MYQVGGFRSTVPESAGWHSHIPEPDDDDVCPECDGLGVVVYGRNAAECPTCHGAGCYEREV
jgi:hypothetical protein